MVLSKVSRDRRPDRIALWVVPVADLGGVARHVLDVARVRLPGWRLFVLCPEGQLAERLRAVGSAVITAPFGPDAGFRASVSTLRMNIKRLRPDVVHSHLAYADVVAAAAVIGLKTRLVTTEHGIAGDDAVYHGSVWRSRSKALMHRVRLRRADIVIAVSEATRDTMLAKWKPKQPVHVIPNGVDAVEVRRKVDVLRAEIRAAAGGDAPLRVLSLSRLAPEKRLDVLLRAFALVLRSEPTARLIVAGAGPELEPLQQLAAQLRISTSVDFVGFVDPLRAMAAADVLVQLSVWENCSYTLLDAVSAGMGVVATAVGGNPEIVPASCLVSGEDADQVAGVLLAQSQRASSPSAPAGDGLLGVQAMTVRIGKAYSTVMT